ncbi:MAG: aminomethyl-transferring glycine dehydrogenase subunit GcvPA [Candidatus Hodarchaeota archaeon]
MDYTPHSTDEIKHVMNSLGINNLDELFKNIPPRLLIKDEGLGDVLKSGILSSEGLTEMELNAHVQELASNNVHYTGIFQGAGCYNHYIPACVDFICSRSEFWTSYTPYQAEMSQGFLQVIFEYQSLISRLTGMKYSNASHHDGATALIDAILMAKAENKKRNTVLFAGEINPIYITVVNHALAPRKYNLNCSEISKIIDAIDPDTMAVVIQNPTFFGDILDLEKIVKDIKDKDNKIVIIQLTTEPLSLALLKSPGKAGIDIFVGDGQSFGIPMSFGGPGLGIVSVNGKKMLHRMPGRIVGIGPQLDGSGYGYTLTLQGREQHIRRERALSNICSNEALNMLRAAVYLASTGGTGLKQLAEINVIKSNFLKNELDSMSNFECINTRPTFNEFVAKTKKMGIDTILNACNNSGILGPIKLENYNDGWKDLMLFCVTELNDIASLNNMIEILQEGS